MADVRCQDCRTTSAVPPCRRGGEHRMDGMRDAFAGGGWSGRSGNAAWMRASKPRPRASAGATCIVLQLLVVGQLAAAGRDAAPALSTGDQFHAEAATGLARLVLPEGTVRTDLGEGLAVSGVPVRIEVFDAPAPFAATMDTLVAGLGALPEVVTLADAVLLHWRTHQGQWLARLQADGPMRTRGTLSLLGGGQAVRPTRQWPDWAPAGLQLQFELAQAQAMQRQRIYTHALPPRQLAQRLDASLRRAGWRPVPGPGPGQRWARQGRSLSLLLVPLSAGSGVFVLESQP